MPRETSKQSILLRTAVGVLFRVKVILVQSGFSTLVACCNVNISSSLPRNPVQGGIGFHNISGA